VVEQPIRNRQVVGSTPTLGSIFLVSGPDKGRKFRACLTPRQRRDIQPSGFPERFARNYHLPSLILHCTSNFATTDPTGRNGFISAKPDPR
jgi:hypothetical protein